jgi:hypothetical protein
MLRINPKRPPERAFVLSDPLDAESLDSRLKIRRLLLDISSPLENVSLMSYYLISIGGAFHSSKPDVGLLVCPLC